MFVNQIKISTLSAPVKSATIFQSSTAEVTRTLALELKSGKNVVTIKGISSDADSESPRISGTPDGVRVLDVVCRRHPHDAPDLRDDVTSSQIEANLASTRALAAEREVRQQEVRFLNDAGRAIISPPQGANNTANWHAELLGFVDGFVKRQIAAEAALRDLDAKIAALEKSLWLLRSARKGEATTTIVATIVAQSDSKVDLKLTYLVSGVSWKPYYDLHATTADGRPSADVSLRYCATISQSTGEDWTDATLTLSMATTQAQWRLSVPSVLPLKIRVGAAKGSGFATSAFGAGPALRQSLPAPTTAAFGAFGAAPTQANQGFAGPGGMLFGAAPTAQAQPTQGGGLFGNAQTQAAPAPAGGLFGQAQTQTAPAPTVQGLFGTAQGQTAPAQAPGGLFGTTADTTEQDEAPPTPAPAPNRNALSLAYRVEGTVSLPSDGEAHKLTIAALDFKAALKYVCVPQQSQAAFIVGTVKNTSEYELLAGPVSVFMDDSFVTKTSVDFIAVNESFPCVLGVDTSLKVTYRQSSKTEHEPRRNFAEPHKTIARTAITTIANQHAHAVTELVVRDAIPLGNEDLQVVVMLRKPAGLAEAIQGAEVAMKLAEAQAGVTAKARWTEVEDGKGGEKDGLYEWVCAIPPGKKITLEAQWDVKGPSDVQWSEVPQRALFGWP
ncbi:uncharacterized protein TRAVEDRAFT_72848 [Trametes versicolor FP-101664 SS1]|uniref:uncharacterized protein n=1 Tax=Trametes versicolor (strain FP-101664) TaxID=717944 RepID=UPI00046223A2|nr:uncharacterized protein TRAVEDRAFT_72848 [Trametes versicolor FP-101664 SS1]EIW57933.1 hypothetical protein TRAVEDRAFT_72848 [Trametes versicolor FP-101664 SS1]